MEGGEWFVTSSFSLEGGTCSWGSGLALEQSRKSSRASNVSGPAVITFVFAAKCLESIVVGLKAIYPGPTGHVLRWPSG